MNRLSLHCFHFGLHFGNNSILYFATHITFYCLWALVTIYSVLYRWGLILFAMVMFAQNFQPLFSDKYFFGQYFSCAFPSFILENLCINFVLILFWWITHYYFSWFSYSQGSFHIRLGKSPDINMFLYLCFPLLNCGWQCSTHCSGQRICHWFSFLAQVCRHKHSLSVKFFVIFLASQHITFSPKKYYQSGILLSFT